MKSIRIDHSKKIAALQQEFNEMFPFLKLEFFGQRHVTFKGSARRDQVDTSVTLGELNRKHAKGMIVLKDDMKVSELEELFRDNFGLNVQVFRKSGRAW